MKVRVILNRQDINGEWQKKSFDNVVDTFCIAGDLFLTQKNDDGSPNRDVEFKAHEIFYWTAYDMPLLVGDE